MGYHILNEKDEIIGWSEHRFTPANGQRLIDDKEPVTKPPRQKLTEVRETKVLDIKAQATELIEATNWRLERANERDLIGALRPTDETPMQVYAEREAIRRASNRAEEEVNKIRKIDDVINYVFDVKTTDYPPKTALTHLQFLRRFTAEERAIITSLRTKNQAIGDYMKMLEVAKFINMTDPAVILGVNMLETSGIIATGRASQILEDNQERSL